MREQLLNLLGQGATRAEAISITGASEDLVTECLQDPDFIAQIKEKRENHRQEIIEQSYAKLEQATLTKLSKELEYADIPSLCKVLDTTARNRVLHRNPSGHYTNPTTHLTVEIKMPSAAGAQNLIIDGKTNQIVAIGDRNMSGLPVQGVQKLFKRLEKQLTDQTEERRVLDADLQNPQGVHHEHPDQGNQANEPAYAQNAA